MTYADRFLVEATAVAGPSGSEVLVLATVPVGKVAYVHFFAARDRTSGATIELQFVSGGIAYPLSAPDYVVANGLQKMIPHQVVLKEGDGLQIQYGECIEGDNLQAYAMGQLDSVP